MIPLLWMVGFSQTPPAQAAPVSPVLRAFRKLEWIPGKNRPQIIVDQPTAAGAIDLTGLGIKRVQIGDVTAFVPERRKKTEIDIPDINNPAEVWSPESKLLYLVSHLSTGQLHKMSHEGITLGDCQGETANILRSLFPTGVVVLAKQEGNSISYGDASPTQEMSAVDPGKIRLRLKRLANLAGGIQEAGRGSMTRGIAFDSPRSNVWQAKSQGDRSIISEWVDNQLKPSDLPRKATFLAETLPLQPSESVSSLLKRISAKVGREFITHPAIADRLVESHGPSATIQDILASIQVGLSGSYRKVGSSFYLCEDRMPFPVQRELLNLAYLEGDLKADAMLNGLNSAFGASFTASIPLASGFESYLSPTQRAAIEHLDSGQSVEVSAETLMPSARELTSQWIEEVRQNMKGTPICRIGQEVRAELVFPDGVAVAPSIPFTTTPNRVWGQRRYNVQAVMRNVGTRTKLGVAPKAVLLRAETPEDVKPVLELAKETKAPSIWLESRNLNVIQAVREGLESNHQELCLVIRPWRIDRSSQEPILTPIGETALQANKWARDLASYARYYRDSLHNFPQEPYEQFSAESPSSTLRMEELAKLAAASQCSQIVLADPYPNGIYQFYYGGGQNDFRYMFLAWVAHEGRLAVLRKSGLDPLDCGPRINLEGVSSAWADLDAFGRTPPEQTYFGWVDKLRATYKEKIDILTRSISALRPGLTIMCQDAPDQNNSDPLDPQLVIKPLAGNSRRPAVLRTFLFASDDWTKAVATGDFNGYDGVADLSSVPLRRAVDLYRTCFPPAKN